jgi:LysM domain
MCSVIVEHMFGISLMGRILLVALAVLLLWTLFAGESGASGPEQSYRVRPGDTLWSIAERTFAGDPREGVWKLRERNGLDSATIIPGQTLVVPS